MTDSIRTEFVGNPDRVDTADVPIGETVAQVLSRINEVILGKPLQAKLALSCLVAGGHLLIEDVPGVGKTTLGQVLARVLGLELSRIQFTSDLLPADIVATPKAQSALLEAMEEHQVTVDGESHVLPKPFFVIATQNPMNQVGTFPLPESQLDRFMMRIGIGYPDPLAEKQLLTRPDTRIILSGLASLMSADKVIELQVAAASVHTSVALVDYAQALLAASRRSPWLLQGLSPRAGIALVGAARAWALLNGQDHVVPEDLQQVAAAVLDHRLQPAEREVPAGGLAERLIRETDIP